MSDTGIRLELYKAVDDCDNIENLRKSLLFAVRIIESYKLDINCTGVIKEMDFVGVNLKEVGFCQGSIYEDCYKMIIESLSGRTF